uniref:Uncharacterized protein n=1 Tax=Arundo donax TaxID=35708 RepID=A0A0A9DDK6_ARUDO
MWRRPAFPWQGAVAACSEPANCELAVCQASSRARKRDWRRRAGGGSGDVARERAQIQISTLMLNVGLARAESVLGDAIRLGLPPDHSSPRTAAPRRRRRRRASDAGRPGEPRRRHLPLLRRRRGLPMRALELFDEMPRSAVAPVAWSYMLQRAHATSVLIRPPSGRLLVPVLR